MYDTCKTANIKTLGDEILLSDLAVTSFTKALPIYVC
jgi:hypothetical protein